MISTLLLSNAIFGCNGPCRTLNDYSSKLICINGKCNDDPNVGTRICIGISSPPPPVPAAGTCRATGSLRCDDKRYPTYTCSPPVTSSTRASLTNNDFSEGCDGGYPSAYDEQHHSNSDGVVALSTGWYNGGSRCGSRCGNMIRIRESNGRTYSLRLLTSMTQELDVMKNMLAYPHCLSNIVDRSDMVWSTLALNKDVVIVDVT